MRSTGTLQTSGIQGGYRLVSTYDLPDCKLTGGSNSGVNFGHLKSEVFHLAGYSGVNLVISNLKFFIKGGGGRLWSEIQERGFLENLDKNLLFEECVQECACASHTTYEETNQVHVSQCATLVHFCSMTVRRLPVAAAFSVGSLRLAIWSCCSEKQTGRTSSGSSGRVRGTEKHEIYAAAFGSHLFMTNFYVTEWVNWYLASFGVEFCSFLLLLSSSCYCGN